MILEMLAILNIFQCCYLLTATGIINLPNSLPDKISWYLCIIVHLFILTGELQQQIYRE